jgi:hypothetical protein
MPAKKKRSPKTAARSRAVAQHNDKETPPAVPHGGAGRSGKVRGDQAAHNTRRYAFRRT